MVCELIAMEKISPLADERLKKENPKQGELQPSIKLSNDEEDKQHPRPKTRGRDSKKLK